MMVILRENVENLGHTGDVVKVSDGYARNYLLPRNLVVLADENNVRQIENHRKQLQKKRAAQRAIAEASAKKLGEVQVTLARKVGEGDKLFGSVTGADIADALKKQGFEVERRGVVLEHPIRSLGVHPVTLKLDQGVTASVKVWVVKEEG